MHIYSEFEDNGIKVKIYIPKNKTDRLHIQYRRGRKLLKKETFMLENGIILDPSSSMLERLDDTVNKGLEELLCQIS